MVSPGKRLGKTKRRFVWKLAQGESIVSQTKSSTQSLLATASPGSPSVYRNTCPLLVSYIAKNQNLLEDIHVHGAMCTAVRAGRLETVSLLLVEAQRRNVKALKQKTDT